MALKWRSKKEMYDVLMNDCGVYLPPIEYANGSNIRNIMTGKTKVRKWLFTTYLLVYKMLWCENNISSTYWHSHDKANNDIRQK